jgi:hypothetical protein
MVGTLGTFAKGLCAVPHTKELKEHMFLQEDITVVIF